jgi:hypothetical protein
MTAALSRAGAAIRARKGLFAAVLVGFVALYYASLFGAMLVGFGQVPNYVTVYDWPVNVWHIFASTPSLADAFAIARQEWLLEIGFMNYSFGHGIAEWNVTVWPTRLSMVLLAGLMVSACAVLTFPGSRAACSVPARRAALAAAGGGAFLVGLSNATLHWVVACATPTWTVTLAMLGMPPAVALWLEPLDTPMIGAGYALLAGAVLLLAHRHVPDIEADQRTGVRLNPPLYSRG